MKEGYKQPVNHNDNNDTLMNPNESKSNLEPDCVLNIALADKMWNDNRTTLELTCHHHDITAMVKTGDRKCEKMDVKYFVILFQNEKDYTNFKDLLTT